MRKVILLRHAKSSWADPDLEDHARPLAPRGARAAPVIATWLVTRGHRPDLVLCSSATRARQTVERMAEAINMPEAIIDAGLYHASPDQICQRIADLPETVRTVMIVGHQPGLSATARKLANGNVRPGCRRAFEHFPTAAAAVLELAGPRWGDLAYGTARFVDFAKPRELMEA